MKRCLLMSAITAPFLATAAPSLADPTVFDPNLAVNTAVAGLSAHTGMAFLPNNDSTTSTGSWEKGNGSTERRPA
jgi:hypothetical protein